MWSSDAFRIARPTVSSLALRSLCSFAIAVSSYLAAPVCPASFPLCCRDSCCDVGCVTYRVVVDAGESEVSSPQPLLRLSACVGVRRLENIRPSCVFMLYSHCLLDGHSVLVVGCERILVVDGVWGLLGTVFEAVLGGLGLGQFDNFIQPFLHVHRWPNFAAVSQRWA